MSHSTSTSDTWQAIRAKLDSIHAPDLVVRIFKRHFDSLTSNEDNFISQSEISPIDGLADAEAFGADLEKIGEENLSKAVVLKLNGGLGTSMGLKGPKSLLPVRGDKTFLDIIIDQMQSMSIPLVLMNSFSTESQTRNLIESRDLQDLNVINFTQNRVPKLRTKTFDPVEWTKDENLEWCPPGHGDIYSALQTTGTLEKLISDGFRYLFVSNADNLGATMSKEILGHFVKSGATFLMEVADRTFADRKGGHLAVSKEEPAGLLLREKAQCRKEELPDFEKFETYKYFNTNNLWLDLLQLRDALVENDGILALPLIINEKNVDPEDDSSDDVIQLETAMGAAISCLNGASAVRVPRTRFAPVKTIEDFLSVRSDAYEVKEDHSVQLIPNRNGTPPKINLDDDYFKTISDLNKRIPEAPSLRDCESLTIKGNVFLSPGITIKGNVTFEAPKGESKTIEPGEY